MDLVTLAQTLDEHGVRFRKQPQLGNASVVLVGPSMDFEAGMRAMFFSSADILEDFPAPIVAVAPVVVEQIATTATVEAVTPRP